MARAERVAEVLGADDVLEDRARRLRRGPRDRARSSSTRRRVRATRPTGPVLDGRLAARSRPASASRSSGRRARASRRSARSSRASTTRPPGAVLIDGRDARDCSLDWLRDQVGDPAAGHRAVHRHRRREHRLRRATRPREDDRPRPRARPTPRTSSRALPDGYDTRARPAGRRALGRPAPAHRHRARAPARPADPRPRRADDGPRRRERGAGHGRPARASWRAARRSSSPTRWRSRARPTTSSWSRAGGSSQQGTPDELIAVPGAFRRLAAEQGLVERRRRAAPPPDPAVPAMRALLDPDGAAPMLQRSLGDARRIEDIRVRQVRYRPGEDITVLYRAVVDGERHEAVVSAGRDVAFEAVAGDPRHLQIARAVDGRSPAPNPLAYDAPADALIQWLPLDLAPAAHVRTPEASPAICSRSGSSSTTARSSRPASPTRPGAGRRCASATTCCAATATRRRSAGRSPAGGSRRTGRSAATPSRCSRGATCSAAARAGARAAAGPPPRVRGRRPRTVRGRAPELRTTVQLVLDGTRTGSSLHTAHSAGALLRRIHDLPARGPRGAHGGGHARGDAPRPPRADARSRRPPRTGRRSCCERLASTRAARGDDGHLARRLPQRRAHPARRRARRARRRRGVPAAPARDLASYAAYAASARTTTPPRSSTGSWPATTPSGPTA